MREMETLALELFAITEGRAVRGVRIKLNTDKTGKASSALITLPIKKRKRVRPREREGERRKKKEETRENFS
jgi:hypothetical protein